MGSRPPHQVFESRTFKTSSYGPTSVPDPPPSYATSKPGDGKMGLGAFSTGLYSIRFCQSSHLSPIRSIIRRGRFWMLISDAGYATLLMHAHIEHNGQNAYFWREHCPGPDSWPVESNRPDPFQAGSSSVEVGTARKCNPPVDVGRRSENSNAGTARACRACRASQLVRGRPMTSVTMRSCACRQLARDAWVCPGLLHWAVTILGSVVFPRLTVGELTCQSRIITPGRHCIAQFGRPQGHETET